MLQYLSGVSHVNLRKKTQLTKPIYMLFSEIGEDKIMRIKSYSANKLSKLTDMQINVIKITLREKNSCTHVTLEMITSDATAPITLWHFPHFLCLFHYQYHRCHHHWDHRDYE